MMTGRRRRLIDIEPLYSTQGIFTYLNLVAGIPWSTPANALNMVYYGNHSGQKSASPMTRSLADLNTSGTLAAADEQTLAGVAASIYLENWKREYATMAVQYDPIENYNMEETETPAATTRTRTPAETTDTHRPAETTVTSTPPETTQTNTPAETTQTTTPAETTVTTTPAETTQTTTPAETTVTETPAETSVSGSNESGIFGANSSTAVDSDTLSASTHYTTDEAGTVKTETDTAETVKMETDAAETVKTETDAAGTVKTETDAAGTLKTETDTAGTEVTTVQTAETVVRTTQSAETESLEVDGDRYLARHGNIGVTTTQQMLTSEREVWTWNFFYDIVFRDLDNLLTLKVY